MPRKPRRQFTTDQKVAILRRHFVDKIPVSELCEEYELQPSVFYYWQKQAFENLAGALQPCWRRPEPAPIRRVARGAPSSAASNARGHHPGW